MARVPIHVWHDINDGQIIAVGRVEASEFRVVPIAGHRQGVLETQIEEDAVRTLHETHRVDVRNKTLNKVIPSKE